MIAAKLDEYGKAAWIAVTVLGFFAWWPVGLAILFYVIGSGRMRDWRGSRGRWYNTDGSAGGTSSGGGCSWGRRGRFSSAPASGNAAFDEYRRETLRRLEEEQREFFDYLERLRQARDKAEFDQFMADRRNRGSTGGSTVPAEQV
jgi:Protein of unknown function (DUF2852)